MLKRQISILSLTLLLATSVFAKTYHDVDGKIVPASAMKGKWVIINYWAAWCRACIYEIPELNTFYKDNLNKDIIIYGVNYDQLPASDLKKAVTQSEIQFPILQEDPLNKLNSSDVEVLPTTYIVNPQGNIVQKIAGPSTAVILQGTIRDLQE